MLITNKKLILIIISIFAVILSACDNSPRVHESWTPPPEGVVYDDSTISARVKSSLFADRELQGAQIEVKVHQGLVVLEGELDTEDQMTRVNLHTWTVEGVKGVENKIILKGKMPS